MKKQTFILLLSIACSSLLYGQEKGSHLSFSLGGGLSGINYTLLKNPSRNGDHNNGLGGHASFEYAYYFTPHWGLSLGAGASYYRSSGLYGGTERGDYFNLGNQMDDESVPVQYELRGRLMNWQEDQRLLLVDVPLMVRYQHKLGDLKRHGIFWGLGAKVQIPVWSDYRVNDSEYTDLSDENNWRFNLSGYYATTGVEYGHPDKQAVHNLGTISDPSGRLGWGGAMNLDLSWSAVGEVGFLCGLSKRVDLMLGVYGDYGFNNIKKESKALLEAPEGYMAQANGKDLGTGIIYNGMLQSDRVERANLFQVGVRAAVKVKLGRLRSDDHFQDKKVSEQWDKLPYMMPQDTTAVSTTPTDVTKIEDTLDRIEQLLREQEEIRAYLEEAEQRRKRNNSSLDVGVDGYERGVTTLNESQRNELDTYLSKMLEDKTLDLNIVGHTCDYGTAELNMMIGQERADLAKDYLVMNGVLPSRIKTFSAGMNYPLVPNTSEANRKINRRLEFEWIE